MNLREKLVKVSEAMGFLEFDAKNDFQKYGYASAAGVIRKLQQAFIKMGVVATVTDEKVQVIDDMAICQLVLTIRDTESDEIIMAVGCGSGKDKGDKAVMKASTAAYKYAIAHALCLGWGAEDPEQDSPEKSTSKSSQPQQRWSKPKVKVKNG